MTMTNNYNIGLTCDVCGRTVQGVTYMNGMKFCAKCYQETFGNKTVQFVDMLNKEMYDLKISSLEKENAQLKEENRVLDLALNNLLKMYKELFDKKYGKIIETHSIEHIRRQLLQQAKDMLNNGTR